jgi:hypothetical protein
VSALKRSGDVIAMEVGGGFAVYSATLHSDELAGTYRIGTRELPLTLRRMPASTR